MLASQPVESDDWLTTAIPVHMYMTPYTCIYVCIDTKQLPAVRDASDWFHAWTTVLKPLGVWLHVDSDGCSQPVITLYMHLSFQSQESADFCHWSPVYVGSLSCIHLQIHVETHL